MACQMTVAYSKLEHPNGRMGLGNEFVTKQNPLPVTTTTGNGAFTADAFARGRVSAPNNIFQGKTLYDKQSEIFSEKLTGTATSTFNAGASTVTLATAATSDKAERQSAWAIPYEPGHSQRVDMTANFLAHTTGVVKSVGYFDDDDGLFLTSDGVGFYLVVRSSTSGSPVDSATAQASWSEDTLDGSGDANNPSGALLDVAMAQLFFLDFSWLSVGRVRFGFYIDGQWIITHQVNAANRMTGPYMAMPNNHARWEIEATTGSTGSLVAICVSVMSEGGTSTPGHQHGLIRGGTGSTIAGNTPEQLLAIRLKSTHLHAFVTVEALRVMLTTQDNFKWRLVKNPTYTGGSAASWVSVSSSPVE